MAKDRRSSGTKDEPVSPETQVPESVAVEEYVFLRWRKEDPITDFDVLTEDEVMKLDEDDLPWVRAVSKLFYESMCVVYNQWKSLADNAFSMGARVQPTIRIIKEG